MNSPNRAYLGARSVIVLLAALLLGMLQVPVSAQAADPPSCALGEWTGEYFGNRSLEGPPALVRCDPTVDFTWAGAPDGVPVEADEFSVRWSTTQTFAAGSYRFDVQADDGIRVRVDGQLVIDAWREQPATVYSAATTLTAGQHTVVVEFYEGAELARVKVGWTAVADPGPVDCSKGRVVSVVAHIDDDLLFMNPSIWRAISDGKCVRTVAVTAGDAGKSASYWTGREAGHRAACADMAGVPDEWTFGDAGVDGRSILMATNSGNPKVSLVWMRLPDGRPDGSGYPSTGNASLQLLLEGQVNFLRAVDGTETYTRDELQDALREMMTDYSATQIKAHNYISGEGDHSDHFAVARFTQAAAVNGGLSGRLTGYIGYPIGGLPVNVSGADLTTKTNAFYTYAGYDSEVCSTPQACAGTPYAEWLLREYTVDTGGPQASWDVTDPTVQVGKTATFAYTCSVGSTGAISSQLPDWIGPAGGTALTASPTSLGSATVTVTCTDAAGRTASASTTLTAVAAPTPPPSFIDVPPGAVFYNEISWLAANGITQGWPDGTFRPYTPVLRDQMAAFMYRYAGSPAWTPPVQSPFTDVTPQSVFYKEITWLAAKGVTQGWPDGTFRPYTPVLRDQMAAFMYRYAGSPAWTSPVQSPFTDVTPQSVFSREISWLAAKGVTQGWPDGTFRPYKPVLRDQMAAFMYRFAQST